MNLRLPNKQKETDETVTLVLKEHLRNLRREREKEKGHQQRLLKRALKAEGKYVSPPQKRKKDKKSKSS